MFLNPFFIKFLFFTLHMLIKGFARVAFTPLKILRFNQGVGPPSLLFIVEENIPKLNHELQGLKHKTK